jgi:hypothetical protein
MAVQFSRLPDGRSILNLPTAESPAASVASLASAHESAQPEAPAPAQHHRAPGSPRQPIRPSVFNLTRLPIDLQLAIMREIHANPDKPEATDTLDALLHNREPGAINPVNPYLHAVLDFDRPTARSHMRQKALVDAVRNMLLGSVKSLPTSLLLLTPSKDRHEAFNADYSIEHNLDKLAELTYWAQRLDALSEEHVASLVDFATQLNDPSLEENLSHLIGGMGLGLHTLNHDQHRKLVNTILEMADDDFSRALEIFGEGLSSLHNDLKNKLVQKTLAIEDDEYKSIAISGLAKKLEALDATQCYQIAKAAMDIPDEISKDDAIIALSPRLHVFDPTVQMELALEALNLRDTDEHRMQSVDAIARQLARLTPEQYPVMLNTLASALPTAPPIKAMNLISACASALRAPTDEKVNLIHKDLVTRALAFTVEKDAAFVIGSFGPSLHALSDADKERLVNATLNLADEKAKSQAIERLSSGLNALTVDQRKHVFGAMLAMKNEVHKSVAIMGLALGANEGALTDSQLDVLVIKTVGMRSEANKSMAIRSLGHVLHVLGRPQWDSLVNATVTMQDSSSKSDAIQGLSKITGVHRRRLMEATDTLLIEDRIKALEGLSLGWS